MRKSLLNQERKWSCWAAIFSWPLWAVSSAAVFAAATSLLAGEACRPLRHKGDSPWITIDSPCACSEIRPAQRADRGDPRKFDFTTYFTRVYNKVCEKHGEVSVRAVQYHDFDGDGVEEVILRGASCETGTAGPDIHGVYKVLSPTELCELPIDERDTFRGERLYDELVGNGNFSLYADSAGHLIEEWHDRSERPQGESPLILYFTWNGMQFALTDVRRHAQGRSE
jgi:hypothetical protein